MRAALYVRVSTEEQAKEGYSIDAQLNILAAWAIVKGYEIAGRYVDEGYSAKNLRRPAVQQLVTDCKAGKIDAVIVWRLDRLSRNLRDTLTVVEDVFRANNIDFISATESIDTSTPAGRLMLNILASFAQSEREATEERVRMVSMDMARTCVHMGGTPPFGLMVGDDRRYIINEAEAPAVRLLFQMRRDGYGYGEIINALTSAGYCARNGQPFKKHTLNAMLQNEKYMGTYVYNRTVSTGRDGKRSNKSKPDEQIIRIPNGLPAIVDEQTFRVVQERLSDDRTRAGRHKAHRVYIASGLVHCAACGAHMIVENVGRNRNGTYQYSYGCPKNCVPRIRYEKLDTHLFDFFEQITAQPEIIIRASEIANESARLELEDIQLTAQSSQTRLIEVNKSIDSIIAFISSAGASAPASLAHELRQLELERDSLNYDIAISSKNKKIANADVLYQRLTNFVSLRDASPEAQRTALLQIVKEIRIHTEAISIDFCVDRYSEYGGEGGRTPVRKPDDLSISERSLCIDIPSAALPQTGLRLQYLDKIRPGAKISPARTLLL